MCKFLETAAVALDTLVRQAIVEGFSKPQVAEENVMKREVK